jgi:hypothetical protein
MPQGDAAVQLVIIASRSMAIRTCPPWMVIMSCLSPVTACPSNQVLVYSDPDSAGAVRRDQTLYTFNAQCPEVKWAEDGPALEKAAASFLLMPRHS